MFVLEKNIFIDSVIITGKGNYKGSVTNTFKITAKKGTIKIAIPKTVKIVGNTFKVTIGSNVTKFGNKAFKSCIELKSKGQGKKVKIVK